MFSLLVFGSGVVVGVVYKTAILQFKSRAEKAKEAAIKAYKS